MILNNGTQTAVPETSIDPASPVQMAVISCLLHPILAVLIIHTYFLQGGDAGGAHPPGSGRMLLEVGGTAAPPLGPARNSIYHPRNDLPALSLMQCARPPRLTLDPISRDYQHKNN
jgi:hypothetical protein